MTRTGLVATRDLGVRWVLPKRISVDDVEGWFEALDPAVTQVTFHLSYLGCSSLPGAAESLQSAICALHRRGVSTLLSIPETSFEGGRADSLFLPSGVEGRGTEAEKTLACRLPGLILAQLCDPAPGSERLHEVVRRQVRMLDRDSSMFGHGRYRCLAVLGAHDHRTHLRAADEERQNELEDLILSLLTAEGFEPDSDHPLLQELVEFVYQATENTFDHARRTLDGALIRQVRAVSIERHQLGTGASHVRLDSVDTGPEGSLDKYLQALRQRAVLHGENPDELNLLSFTVSDGGVGIAAKMHGGMDVYEHELDYESKFVQLAVLPDGTTKSATETGRGSGTVKMMRAAHRLHGRFEIRTGRLSLARSYVEADGTVDQSLDFDRRDSPAFDLIGGDRERVLAAGTTISVLFPAFDLGANTKRHPGRRGASARGRKSLA